MPSLLDMPWRKVLGGARRPPKADPQAPKAEPPPKGDPATPGGAMPRVAVRDPENVSSDLTPQDYVDPLSLPADEERKWVTYALERFKESSLQRAHLDRQWLESLAHDYGFQWHEWRGDTYTGQFVDLRRPAEMDRYLTSNQVAPLMRKLASLATTSRPDAMPVPLTARPGDVDAAAEARGIDDYVDQQEDGDAQVRQAVDWALRTSTCFVKSVWNAHKRALVPKLGAQGEIVSVAPAPVGDIDEHILSIFEVYLDPTAKAWRHVRWAVHAKVRPLTELIEHYGEAGKRVEPDAHTQYLGYLNARLALATGDLTGFNTHQKGTGEKASALVLELWERPSPRYPKGLLLTVAGDRVLRCRESLPPECAGELPFTPLDYQRGIGTVYARNAVQDLVPLQRAYNRCWSRLGEKLESDKTYICVEQGTEIGADAFESDREKEFIYHVRGSAPPVIAPSPGVGQHWFAALERLYADMQNISGVHDASQGDVPGGVKSGVGFQALTQADSSQLKPFVDNIADFVRRRTEWRLRLYAENCKDGLPRLIGLSEDADPSKALAGAKALTALTAGGQVRVKVRPGSAIPKMPEQQDETLLQMAAHGMFAPEALPSTIALLRMMSVEGGDKLSADLTGVLQQMQQQAQAGQPDPAQVQALKNQAQQQQQQAELQFQAQQQAQGQQHEAELEAVRAHADVEIATVKAQLAAQAASQPKVSLTGALDSTATVAAEREAGLPGDLAEQQQAKALPAVSEANRAQLAHTSEANKTGLARASEQNKTQLAHQGQRQQGESAQAQADLARQKLSQQAEAARQRPAPGGRP